MWFEKKNVQVQLSNIISTQLFLQLSTKLNYMISINSKGRILK